MGNTVSRQLEESFRTALAGNAAMTGIFVLATNEDTVRELPCVVITARSNGRDESVKAAGFSAQQCELRAECIMHGADADSSAAIERLAEAVHAGIESATVTGWLLLLLEFEGIERGFDGQIRSVTLTWRATALPAS